MKSDAPILRSIGNGQLVQPQSAFLEAVNNAKMFEGLTANAEPTHIQIQAEYVNDADHYVIDTAEGAIRVGTIVFEGDLSIRDESVPLIGASEYRQADAEGAIAQSAIFQAQEVQGMKFALEMHRIEQTGVTHVILRKV